MKRLLIAGVALGWMMMRASGQHPDPPPIEWQQTFGGSQDETLTSLQQTLDGGFILGGFSYSAMDGNKTSPNFGGADFWVLRLDANGRRLWEGSFGGRDNDFLSSLEQTADGGFLLGGSSRSGPDGNKTAQNFGSSDCWVVRLDVQGGVLWDHSYGGTSGDYLNSLQQTADGGFVFGGYSSSGTDGNKTAPARGNNDFWVVGLNAKGDLLWDQTFGGGGRDVLYSLSGTREGGLIVGGDTLFSVNGNKTSPLIGSTDFWIVLLDATGNKLRDQSFGGTNDDFLRSLQQTSDGGFILGGSSDSGANGNKTSPNFGGYDFWVVRLDANGNKLWDYSFGGSGHDFLNALQQTTDGGFILGGYSASGADGNKTSPNLGLEDFWVVRLDADGHKLWDQSYGGSGSESLRCLRQTSDGGFILGGRSDSGTSGNKSSPNLGAGDFWVVKLAPERPLLGILRQTPEEIRRTGFRFCLTAGGTNRAYLLEFSTNLTDWAALQTNRVITGRVEIVDPLSTNGAQRFYRARSWP